MVYVGVPLTMETKKKSLYTVGSNAAGASPILKHPKFSLPNTWASSFCSAIETTDMGNLRSDPKSFVLDFFSVAARIFSSRVRLLLYLAGWYPLSGLGFRV